MNLVDFNAGHYEQRYEYKAFLPEPICHEWIIADPELMDLLGRADRALGELNAFSQLIPDIDFFIRMYVAKEATQSSRIEGTQTNIEDAFKNADDLKPEERDDWSEVQNYIRAINFAIAALETLPLSTRLLRQTHAELMQGVRGEHKQPGAFRSSQNWIGVSLKNAAFVPPHHEHVPELMGDLEKFLHAEHFFVHPLVRIAIAHYQFETIHPFLDGNGRLGRLMISLYLASEGLLHKPALYLSDYFERNKTAYVDHLMAVRHGNHLRAWLVFFLFGVEETARASASVFRAIIELKQRIERDVLPRFSTRRQDNAHDLMRHLYAQPVIDVKWATNIISVSTNTAAALIAEMVSSGVLIEVTGQRRNRLFAFDEYLRLFRSS
ncbi:Fic family protein [Cellvibrio japonicus]|uniref:Protein adenylyltransferase n=1 Tax=Cellvibrio japonicus (strain Ueda107) TaxID=498211 RepID=B3PE67_CELJU|nr:Fic family protein [Cellvibrio japonicus]ACE85314.1 fic family protein [Cellvibrio japonicus Ueda107]QEI12111.1 Fic family protein [Cellvibrio japonicus]QEI15685.1 Fic family protein [Cellvibrio japonicus]QEI19263.1 Fic family protein [Cellvibrio japonicus]